MKTLSIVVPCFNSAGYMMRAIDSILAVAGAPGQEGGVELIVVDDGSTDATTTIAQEYAASFPDVVRTIRTANGGHGSAVNVGVAAATARYVKIVDSDDWVDEQALISVLATLERLIAAGTEPDLLVTNFVYEKAGKRVTRAVRYANALPRDRVFGWDEFGRFRQSQYMLMHAMTYRLSLLQEMNFTLPSHTFYVDNLYASIPLARVRTLYYLDVDLYRYFIGRPDQSVNESVMIRRIDQQVRVTAMMQAAMPEPGDVHVALYTYLLHYFRIVNAVTSMMLIRSGRREDIERKTELWESMRADDPYLHRRVRRSVLGHLVNLPGRAGRCTTVSAYQVARWVVGFN